MIRRLLFALTFSTALLPISIASAQDVIWHDNHPALQKTSSWPTEAAHAYVAENEGWPLSAYNLFISRPTIGDKAGLVIVRVSHREDNNGYSPETGVFRTGGDKSFELHFDALTKALLRTVGYQ